MLAKPQGFPRKLGGCAGLDPRLRSAVSAGVGDGERGLRRGLRAPGVGVRPKWVLEYSPSNKRIRYFVSITYVRTGLWTAHKFCGGGESSKARPHSENVEVVSGDGFANQHLRPLTRAQTGHLHSEAGKGGEHGIVVPVIDIVVVGRRLALDEAALPRRIEHYQLFGFGDGAAA